MIIEQIISGGQTGADRAALDAAIDLGIPHGGWVPKGRRAEDGPLPEKYHLQEMRTESYPARTEKNVVDSDGTLILSHGELTGGSARTRELATEHGKPWLHIDLDTIDVDPVKVIRGWIGMHGIKTLNVAGPRASKDAGVYAATKDLLKAALAQ